MLTVAQDQALVECRNGDLLLVSVKSSLTGRALRRVVWLGEDWPAARRRYLESRLDDPKAPDAWPPDKTTTLASLERRARYGGDAITSQGAANLRKKWGRKA